MYDLFEGEYEKDEISPHIQYDSNLLTIHILWICRYMKRINKELCLNIDKLLIFGFQTNF